MLTCRALMMEGPPQGRLWYENRSISRKIQLEVAKIAVVFKFGYSLEGTSLNESSVERVFV
jgi:hypothetical protein